MSNKDQQIKTLFEAGYTTPEIAARLGCTVRNVFYRLDIIGLTQPARQRLRKERLQRREEIAVENPPNSSGLTDAVRDALLKAKGFTSLDELCDAVSSGPTAVKDALRELEGQGVTIGEVGNSFTISEPKRGGDFVMDGGAPAERIIRFGVASDKHLCSRFERLDALHKLYDTFEREGITTVYDAGNWIDGFCRLNQNEVLYNTQEDQLLYMAQNHPKVKGLTTYFIAGEDHEGWFTRLTGVDIGWAAEKVAGREGRYDLRYVGFVEKDIVWQASEGVTRIKLFHPGGGSSYATSYKPQKIVESFQGGEKPEILLIGHFHKQGYFHTRNVHTVLAGCLTDQSTFMRKKGLGAEVGGWICEAMQYADGSIQRFRSEWIGFYDRGYHQIPWEYKMNHKQLTQNRMAA